MIHSEISAGLLYLGLATAPIILYLLFSNPKLLHGIPAVGFHKGKMFKSFEEARKAWAEDGPGLLQRGLKQFSGPFQVVTMSGPKIVLPGRFADEIRNNDALSLSAAIHKDFFAQYPGFEMFQDGWHQTATAEMVRGRLTQSLNFITADLLDETTSAGRQLFGTAKTWTEIQFKPAILQLVARVSSRVFVGPELCANDDWLSVSVNFTIHAMEAATALGQWPPILRPFVHWFLPEVRKLKLDISRSRRILAPIFQRRREQNKIPQEAGEKMSKVADTVGWFDDLAKGRPYNDAIMQLSLAFAAIHTTSELLSGIIADLCDHPEWFGPLREDIFTAVKAHGWTKKALGDMKLTDSLMKESQRHHVGDIFSMSRVATQTVKLSDGTNIPKGASTVVALDTMEDSRTFEDPTSYKPQRFLELRQQPGQENKWHFVTTSPEHLAFGHGKHACPGRFFASNEIKVILAYLITSYDWEWAESTPKAQTFSGLVVSTDPNAKAMIKARDGELGSEQACP